MVDRSMTGVYPVLQLPFDGSDRIDEEDLRREVEWAIDCGVDGLAIAMGSGVYKLTDSERDHVLSTVVDQVKGRVRVVMNTGGEATAVAVHYSRRAEELGADALMVRPPSYDPQVAGETVHYFTTVADAVGLPIFVQDQRGAEVAPALAVRLARERENLCYYKAETPPVVPRVAETVSLRGDSGLIVFGGAGGNFFVEELRRGSSGTMPACTMPDVFVRLWRMWRDGNRDGAERESHRYSALLRTLGQGRGMATWLYSEALVRRCIFKAVHVRRPAERPDEHQVTELHRLLDEAGLADS